MDLFFNQISCLRTLASEAQAQKELSERGFLVVPGPISPEILSQLASAYDEVMTHASGPDYKVGSTTTRLFDLVNRGPAFDEVYIYPPLLEACAHLIAEPFKLSSLLGRTLRAATPAQHLHSDLLIGSKDGPMVGFILMVDAFTEHNGATRFVPGSQAWPDLPGHASSQQHHFPGEVLACGEAGSLVIFDASIWHGHTANRTSQPRRSVQGYFVRRSVRSGLNFSDRMLPGTVARLGPLAKYLLEI